MSKINNLIQQFNVNIRKSKKAKNIAIKIINQKVELVIPLWVPLKVGYKFLINKEEWIENKLRNITNINDQANKNQYPIFGKYYDVVHAECRLMKYAKIEGDIIKVYGMKQDINNSLKQLFINIITNKINELCQFYANKHNFSYKKIFIKDLKTKWGSCSSLKNLSFNWRIIFAPIEVVEYLVVHELCHLKEMNHSKKYWKLVEEIYPNYKEQCLWLRKNGTKLYNYL
ncbi:M48 family metallopeptidase [Rickettsiales endosymbiont of Trichoplax sp. H2]|uniref:M48 family metallopeptidase n=1 Tax=Rickettsiales endosymbiont of Trichoplax sp. H2 TaxID=2021221 RepID=UPI0012B2EE2B|nr:SprT family zinc-dependent metalloprotease [Rickettsiales endosymbiont of Trichoplax sp. H2]MSO14320.1 hypothetical protein [Rickettsiales endosymbiont of Trichoplax sp. H2]